MTVGTPTGWLVRHHRSAQTGGSARGYSPSTTTLPHC